MSLTEAENEEWGVFLNEIDLFSNDEETISTSKRKLSQDEILIEDDVSKIPRTKSLSEEVSNVKESRRRRKEKIQERRKEHEKKKDSKKMKILRPNYFLGIKVSNPKIHKAIKQIQENIVNQEPRLLPALVAVPTLHITLDVIHLPDKKSIEKASSALEEYRTVLQEKFLQKPLILNFSGVDTFNKQVLFSCVKKNDSFKALEELSKTAESIFKQIEENRAMQKSGFKPHLTILKLSKCKYSKEKKLRKIPEEIISTLKETEIGDQTVQGIQLLSMNQRKDEFGYYHCVNEICFDVPHEESADHTDCCLKPPMKKRDPYPKILELSKSIQQQKLNIKRRFHSLCSSKLSSILDSNTEVNDSQFSSEINIDPLKCFILLGVASVITLSVLKFIVNK